MSQQQPRGSSTTTSRSWSSHSSSEYVSLSIRSWLGLDRREPPEFAPLRETLDALDHLDADRARYLAAFAYLIGRVARADLYVSSEETQAMELLVEQQGGLSHEHAMIVVQLAK